MAAECAVPECIDGIQFFWVLHGKRFIVICHTLYIFGHFFTLFYCNILFVRGPRIIMSCQCLWENVTIHSCFFFYVFESLYFFSFHLSFLFHFSIDALHVHICNISLQYYLAFTNKYWYNFLEKNQEFSGFYVYYSYIFSKYLLSEYMLLYRLTLILFSKYFPWISPKQ